MTQQQQTFNVEFNDDLYDNDDIVENEATML